MRVFVYGTLKRDLNNHHLLRDAKFIGGAYTVDTFRMFTVGFPIIRPSDDGASVYGEVYEVDDKTLRRLDALEAEGHMYDRKQVNVVYDKSAGRDIDVIEYNVYVYVGTPKYWDVHSPAPYTHTNGYGELEWHPHR